MKLEKAFTISVTDVSEKPTAIQVIIRAQSNMTLTDLLRKDDNNCSIVINKTSPTKTGTDQYTRDTDESFPLFELVYGSNITHRIRGLFLASHIIVSRVSPTYYG